MAKKTEQQPQGDVSKLLAATVSESAPPDDAAAGAAIDQARRETDDAAPPPVVQQEETRQPPAGEPVAVVPAPPEQKRGRGRPRKDGSAVAAEPASAPRVTRAEALRQLDETRREVEQLKGELHTMHARQNVDAINGLAGVLGMAIQTASRFVAAQRGPHWVYEKEEARENGDAWAVVLAPYSEQLQKHVPLGLALMVTWQGVQKRLDRDAELTTVARSDDAATPAQ